MRALVFLLILGNLVFFAYARGYFGHPARPDSERVAQQLQPEKVVVVARGEGPPATPRPASGPNAPAPNADLPTLCLAWDGLAEREADKLAVAAAALPVGQTLERQADPATRIRHWVRIAPLATRALAERKAAEATKLGVRNHEVVADGEQWALSMGIFSTREAAENHLAALRKQGIRSATLGERADTQARVRTVWRGPAGEAELLRQAIKPAPTACPGTAEAAVGTVAPAANGGATAGSPGPAR